jgi:hypothetical protein
LPNIDVGRSAAAIKILRGGWLREGQSLDLPPGIIELSSFNDVGLCSMSLLESAMFCYPWYSAMMLAFEAGTVIDQRLWKIAQGGAEAAAESHLMVQEKVDALFQAASVLFAGGGSSQIIDMYREHVAANALRLRPILAEQLSKPKATFPS